MGGRRGSHTELSRMEAAIKDLLKDELKLLADAQSKQDETCQEMSKAIQDLSGKVVEREREASELRQSLDKCLQDVEKSAGDNQASREQDAKDLEARISKLEDDADGMGGLKQVHEKCARLETALGDDIRPKLEESVRVVKDKTTLTDELERKMKELNKQCEDFAAKLKASEERVASMEGISATVNVAQEALEDSVTRKYEKLWLDVLNAIEEVKAGQIDVMQQDLNSQKEAAKKECRALVNYATNLMASAHGDRRQMLINRGLVLAWKEQTWISAKRRMGLAYLHNAFQRRQRGVFDVWHRRHTTSALCDRLHGQYTGQLKEIYSVVEDGDKALLDRCHKLDGEVAHLQEKKCTKHGLDQAIEKVQNLLDEEFKALVPINAALKEHGHVLSRHTELHSAHADAEANLDTKLIGLGRDLDDVIEESKSLAKSEEVKGMIRDILLIWNSIKQLDSAKADKKDVDTFALETGNRDKLCSRRLEDLAADLASKSRQETLRDQEKWQDIDSRLDESGRQFKHWEQMWEKLSGFVEDLVAKMGDLQQGGDNKLPATVRMPGRPPSRDGLTQSRTDIPTLPKNHGHDSTSGSRSTLDRSGGGHSHAAATEGLDAKMMWINSAKGIVDASLDQAVHAETPTSASRPRSRPKSASAPPRRPHDRAR